MSRTLLLSVSPGEIWAGLDEEGELTALRVARSGEPSLVGAIILGRIVALRPELPAALIEIGADRPGFLDAKDIDRQRGLAGLTEGEAVIVEVTRDARADKAAGLRLFRDKNDRGERVAAAARGAKPPARLEPTLSPLAVLLGAFGKPAPDRMVIDDRAAFTEARALLAREGGSDRAARLELYTGTAPLFEDAGLAGAIETALARRVALPCGGVLTIDETQAAIMIDVDSGTASALAANLDAAREAAQQIRLRSLAGPIVIDFVGMKKREDRDKVLATLKAALTADREKPELLGWTRLGHVELVRRRRHPSLSEILRERTEEGGWRKTALTVALEALRAAAREALATPGRPLILTAHPDILVALAGGEGLAARRNLEARLGQALATEPSPSPAREAFAIRARSPI